MTKISPHSAQRTLLINSRSISVPHSLWFLGYTLEQETISVYFSRAGVSHFNSISVKKYKKTYHHNIFSLKDFWGACLIWFECDAFPQGDTLHYTI